MGENQKKRKNLIKELNERKENGEENLIIKENHILTETLVSQFSFHRNVHNIRATIFNKQTKSMTTEINSQDHLSVSYFNARSIVIKLSFFIIILIICLLSSC